jgi:hypothetical protein
MDLFGSLINSRSAKIGTSKYGELAAICQSFAPLLCMHAD